MELEQRIISLRPAWAIQQCLKRGGSDGGRKEERDGGKEGGKEGKKETLCAELRLESSGTLESKRNRNIGDQKGLVNSSVL